MYPNSIMDYTFRDWHRKDPAVARLERTWMDPCPECGTTVTTQYVTDNPQAVIGMRNPSCEWDPNDPDSPDCICGPVFVNPRPDPAYDQIVPAGTVYTLKPCGHTVSKLMIYMEGRAEPGTLGELMELWGKADG